MKILFIGLGSIGRRHLMNVRSYFKNKEMNLVVHCLKQSNRPLENIEVDKVIYNFEELDIDYDAIFIANPTDMHYETLKKVKTIGKYFFLEKPVFDQYNYDIAFLEEEDISTIYVASPLRYTQMLVRVRELIQTEKIYSIRAICSTYLPDWRGNTDYRNIYSAHKKEGGGVSIDCIHEWDYISNLIGLPEKVFNLQDKVSNLEVFCEDISIYVARTKDIFIELHLDYFGKSWRRQFEIITESGYIKGDFINKKIYLSKEGKEEVFHYEPNEMYEREIQYFFNVVCKDKGNWNDIIHAMKLLKVVKEAEENESSNNNLWTCRV